MPRLRIIGTMDAVAIMLPRPDLRQVDMPDVIGAFLDPNPVRFFTDVGVVEQAEIRRRGIFRKQREVHAFAIPRGAKRVGTPRPNSHA